VINLEGREGAYDDAKIAVKLQSNFANACAQAWFSPQWLNGWIKPKYDKNSSS